jgi:hypothetical protein
VTGRRRWRDGVIAAGMAALAACGAGGGDQLAAAEEEVAVLIAGHLERDAGDVVVDCSQAGAGDPGPGDLLDCRVEADGGEPQLLRLAVGEDGTADLVTAVIPVRAAESYLAGELGGAAGSSVAVSCGDRPLVVGEVGDAFTCRAERAGDGGAFAIEVEITAPDGTVRYRVEPVEPVEPG